MEILEDLKAVARAAQDHLLNPRYVDREPHKRTTADVLREALAKVMSQESEGDK